MRDINYALARKEVGGSATVLYTSQVSWKQNKKRENSNQRSLTVKEKMEVKKTGKPLTAKPLLVVVVPT